MNVSMCLFVFLLCAAAAQASTIKNEVPPVAEGSRRTFLTITETGEVLQGVHHESASEFACRTGRGLQCDEEIESTMDDVMRMMRTVVNEYKVSVGACDENCLDAKIRAIVNEKQAHKVSVGACDERCLDASPSSCDPVTGMCDRGLEGIRHKATEPPKENNQDASSKAVQIIANHTSDANQALITGIFMGICIGFGVVFVGICAIVCNGYAIVFGNTCICDGTKCSDEENSPEQTTSPEEEDSEEEEVSVQEQYVIQNSFNAAVRSSKFGLSVLS